MGTCCCNYQGSLGVVLSAHICKVNIIAVEVLSEGNTPKEMARKLKEYFLAGVLLVWFVEPTQRTVTVYTAPDRSTVLTEDQTLEGGDVLPGLALPLRTVFAEIPPQTTTPPRKKRPAQRRPRKK